jgi:hypothetical protein
MESNPLTQKNKVYDQEKLTEFMPRFCDHAIHISPEENIYSTQGCVVCNLNHTGHYTFPGRPPTTASFCRLMEVIEEPIENNNGTIRLHFKLDQKAMYSCSNRHNSLLCFGE